MLTGLGFSPISDTSGVDSKGAGFCQLFSNSNVRGITSKAFKMALESWQNSEFYVKFHGESIFDGLRDVRSR